MAALPSNDGFSPSLHDDGDDVAKMPNGFGSVTHEQIIGALGRVEGLIEAESESRKEFRETFLRRLETVEQRTGAIAIDVQRIEHKLETRKPAGSVAAIVQLFERQPLLAVIIGAVVLGLGSGGIISIWESLTK